MTKYIALLIVAIAAQTALAVPVPDTIFTYQGELKDSGGVANGSYDMSFSLWDVDAGGIQIGLTIDKLGVVVTDGRFTVQLDMGANAFDNNSRWLEITVEGFTLSPRQLITRSPYSIQTRGIFVDDSNNVGIGTTTPTVPLDVAGTIRSFGPSGGSITTQNPNNQTASFGIGWLNDVARLRIGGVGAGAFGGLDIQRTGSASLMRILHNGNVGIGTTTPNAKLNVVGDGSGAVTRITNGGGSCAGMTNTGLIVGDVCGAGRAASFYGVTTNAVVSVTNDGTGKAATFGGDVSFNGGNIGIGTSSPDVKLHVEGGSDTSPTGGGFLVLGSTASANISIDNNEIMARNNGATSTLFLNNNGGNIVCGGSIDINYSIVVAAGSADATCPAGTKVLGGGCFIGGNAEIRKSYPSSDTNWHCEAGDQVGFFVFNSYAICANVK